MLLVAVHFEGLDGFGPPKVQSVGFLSSLTLSLEIERRPRQRCCFSLQHPYKYSLPMGRDQIRTITLFQRPRFLHFPRG